MRIARYGLLIVLGLGLGGLALGQPMMMDPSKMSGIPRPDPQVPAGTITVRLIRGQLSNRMTGVTVTLTGPDGKAVKQKTDAEGRATFSGLAAPGPFLATAKDGDTDLKTQPLSLEPSMGTRVMLVFPASGAGAPDGTGHPDKTLPVGTIVVRAEDATGNGIEGLDVVLAHATAADKVDELKGKTDVAGEAKFSGLDHTPTSGYMAQVTASGVPFQGKPFKLDATSGAKVVLQIRAVTKDLSQLSFAEGSHMLVEVTDDALQVIQVYRLRNAGSAAIDPGADGLHIPLPDDAVGLQAPDTTSTPALSIVGKEAVYKAPIPPGDTQLRTAFTIPRHGATVELNQRTPIPFARVALVTQLLPGLTVTGHEVQGEEREMQGRKLMVFFGGATKRDGVLSLTFGGLPAADPSSRYAAAAVSILLVLVFTIYAMGGDGSERGRLERERQALFDELRAIDVAIARGDAGDLPQKREKRVARLAEIYRGLDELGGRVTADAAAVVKGKGLYQAYGRQAALRGVDIELRGGEAVALLGPNGAGKSTLLRILSSLERPARGEVIWPGDLPDAEVRRRIGLVAHESLCYGDLSARENLRFFADLYDVADRDRRVEALLERVALVDAADRPVRTYSRGMLQRIAVARALVHQPALLLLDEPFTGLDRQGVALLAQLLADEKARGAAILVVSHDLPAIAQLVDRALVLLRGRLHIDEVLSGTDREPALARLYDEAVGARVGAEFAVAGAP